MNNIETLRYKLHIAINEQNQVKVLSVSRQLDQEIIKYIKKTKDCIPTAGRRIV